MNEPSAAELSRRAVAHILTTLTTTSHRGVVVDSPPGAGKTTLVVHAAQHLTRPQHPCMIVAQTNAQVDDLVIRLTQDAPHLTVARLSGQSYWAPDRLQAGPNLIITTDARQAAAADVAVATASKWANVQDWHRRWAIVDEAYQMRSDNLLQIAHLADQALFVGDPGQLDPFSTIPTQPWKGLAHDPMASAVSILLKMNPQLPVLSLPVSWRLPASAAPSSPLPSTPPPSAPEPPTPNAGSPSPTRACTAAPSSRPWISPPAPDGPCTNYPPDTPAASTLRQPTPRSASRSAC